MKKVAKGIFKEEDGSYVVDTHLKPTGGDKHVYVRIHKRGLKSLEEAQRVIETRALETPTVSQMTAHERYKRRAKLSRQIPYIKAVFGYRCAHCGALPEPSDLEIHHIIPLAEGGADIIENVIPLCHECHRKAHAGEIDWFDLFLKSKTEVMLYAEWALQCVATEYSFQGRPVPQDASEISDVRDNVKFFLKGQPVYYHGGTEFIYPRGVRKPK